MPRHDGRPFVSFGESIGTSEGIMFTTPVRGWSNEPDPEQLERDEENDRKQTIRDLIRESSQCAITLISNGDYGNEELHEEMVFNDAEDIGNGLIRVTCIFDRNNKENFGKQFDIPYQLLMSYRRAVDLHSRNFIRLGDKVIGLKNSSGYAITSYKALFIGEAMESERVRYADLEPGTVYHRHWGDTYINLKTNFSLEGYIGQCHEVNATCFIPTHDPTDYFTKINSEFSHVGIYSNIPGIIPGVIYPVEGINFSENMDITISVEGFEPIPFNKDNITLILKGELE